MKRICFLSAAHTPLDKRVFAKEAVSLARAGYDVVHLAPDKAPSAWEQDGVRIETYRRPNGRAGRFLQLPRLYRAASHLGADSYHCNEVDSWLVGVGLKLLRGRKVVFDVHEHYPSAFETSRLPGWAQAVLAALMRLFFRMLSPFTDRLVFAKKFLDPDFPGTTSRQVLVENFAQLAYRRLEAPSALRSRSQSEVTAVHTGLMGRGRGWPELVRALALSRSPGLRLLVIGTFNDGSREDFDRTVTELALADRVRVEEWMPTEEAYRCLLEADIGIVLFQPGVTNHVLALPHKMFDYMLAGLPVVAPAFALEVAEIIRDADCGILVDPSSPEDVARALERLATDPAERRRLGQNGRQAVIERYNWENEERKLLEMYHGLIGPPRTPEPAGSPA